MKSVLIPDAMVVFAGSSVEFSGQSLVSMWTVDSLKGLGLEVRKVIFPSSNKGGVKYLTLFSIELIFKLLRALRVSPPVVICALGQSYPSFFREGVFVILLKILRRKSLLILVLHSSYFLTWNSNSVKMKIFTFILNKADRIGVLGPHQLQRLNESGMIVPMFIHSNTTDMQALENCDITSKHSVPVANMKVLFLSSLFESKGYEEYLEAVKILAKRGSLQCEFILAGSVSNNPWNTRFKVAQDAESWVNDQISVIRHLGGRIRRVPSVSRAVAASLMREAHIFVFPSRIEGQPVVLIEAMAAGAAILTTKVGEIEWMLSKNSAEFLESTTPDVIAAAIEKLASAPEKRIELGTAAIEIFRRNFSKTAFAEQWRAILARGSS